MAKTGFDSPFPSWVRQWMVINAGILLYDGCFCVLRPHSMGDGLVGKLYYPYRPYTAVDKNYANPDDSFVWAQGFGNLIESMLCLMVFFNCLGTIRRSKLLALAVSVMTFWKTILFMVYSIDFAKGGKVVHDWPRELVLVYGLGSIWIIVPAYVIYTILQDFGWAEGKRGSSSSKNIEDDNDGKHHYKLRNRRA